MHKVNEFKVGQVYRLTDDVNSNTHGYFHKPGLYEVIPYRNGLISIAGYLHCKRLADNVVTDLPSWCLKFLKEVKTSA